MKEPWRTNTISVEIHGVGHQSSSIYIPMSEQKLVSMSWTPAGSPNLLVPQPRPTQSRAVKDKCMWSITYLNNIHPLAGSSCSVESCRRDKSAFKRNDSVSFHLAQIAPEDTPCAWYIQSDILTSNLQTSNPFTAHRTFNTSNAYLTRQSCKLQYSYLQSIVKTSTTYSKPKTCWNKRSNCNWKTQDWHDYMVKQIYHGLFCWQEHSDVYWALDRWREHTVSPSMSARSQSL